MESEEQIKSLEEIELEYKKSLEIPKFNPVRQFFFCPVGLVGSGKTTITKALSEKFWLIRISSDELRKNLKENGYDYSSVKEIGFKIAREFSRKGFSIAFDMDCGNPAVKNFVEALAKKLQCEIIWVHVDTPEDHVFLKFKKYPPSWLADSPETMIANYRAQKERRVKENTVFNYFFTFDTSQPNLNNQIDNCARKIENFLSRKGKGATLNFRRLKSLFLIFATAFILNVFWENVHSVLYISYKSAPITEFILLRAALVDAVIITLLALPFMQLEALGRRLWLVVPFGVLISIVIELWALQMGRWVYDVSMPIVPFLNVGLLPTIQLGILGYIVYVFVFRHVGKNEKSIIP